MKKVTIFACVSIVCCMLIVSTACQSTETSVSSSGPHAGYVPPSADPPTTSCSQTDSSSTVETEPSVSSNSPDDSQTVCTHNRVVKKAVKATCTSSGLTEGSYCSLCGKVFKKQEIVSVEHTYHNYKCISCGKFQEGHACDYLKIWLIENGDISGEYASLHWYNESHDQFGILYDASCDRLSLTYLSDVSTATQQYFMLWLDPNTTTYSYWATYGEAKPYDSEAFGTIDAKTFTGQSPITCTSYSGRNRALFLELVRATAAVSLTWMEDYLAFQGAGITIADLGFTKF